MLYLDSSAIVKLVLRERESAALFRGVQGERFASSHLAIAEVMRATRRSQDAARVIARARAILDDMVMVAVDASILEAAGRLDPVSVRTLDAIHVVSALDLGDEIEALITYDDRMAAAAADAGLDVRSPA